MRIIDRHIGRAIVSHALLGLAVFTFIFFVPQMARIMELVARHSAPLPAKSSSCFSPPFPSVLTFTIPMGLLIGILIGLGGLSADSELIAMNATGMGLRRLLDSGRRRGPVRRRHHAVHDPVAGADFRAPLSRRLGTLAHRPSLVCRFNPASSMSDSLTWCCTCRMFRPQPPTGVESSWWNRIRTMYRV